MPVQADVTVIIPARLGSSRLPGKVLLDTTGKPLIRHVVEAAARGECVRRVVVATDDERVALVVRRFGAEAVLTSTSHQNGTSRLAEAADILSLPDDQIVVNVQGDEPELEAHAIDAAVESLITSGAEIATVASAFAPGEDASNPNVVKVVRRLDGTALYFSRALVPLERDPGKGVAHPLKHVGLYVYRAGVLRRYARLDATPLERTEMLEQLRALENGWRIGVAVVECHTQGIDTPEQYDAFVQRWRRAHPPGE